MYKITGTEVYPVSVPIKLKTRNRAGGEETENVRYRNQNIQRRKYVKM